MVTYLLFYWCPFHTRPNKCAHTLILACAITYHLWPTRDTEVQQGCLDPTMALWSARTWRSPRTLGAPRDTKIHQRNTVPQEIPGFTQNTGEYWEPPRSVEWSRNTVVSRDHRSTRDMGGGHQDTGVLHRYQGPPQTPGFTGGINYFETNTRGSSVKTNEWIEWSRI